MKIKGNKEGNWNIELGEENTQGEKSENFQYQNDPCTAKGSCLLYTCKADRHVHGRNQQEDGLLKDVFILNGRIIAPIIAPKIPDIATGNPIFQFINLSFIVVIIAAIDVGTKNIKLVA